MAFYGHFIRLYGLSWQSIDLIGLASSFLAVIDPNSFGLVIEKLNQNNYWTLRVEQGRNGSV